MLEYPNGWSVLLSIVIMIPETQARAIERASTGTEAGGAVAYGDGVILEWDLTYSVQGMKMIGFETR